MNLRFIAYISLLIALAFSPVHAETTLLSDNELRTITGQAITAVQREAAEDMGELVCLVLCPTTQSLFLNVSLTLDGGVTGALFGVEGDFGSGFIGSALNSIENAFNL
ncbi:MAG TPA: hypothetical protein DCZ03_11360 [Gammaproteobacteria bacterium]|nr:hypothetical protein [Gammaproteobacteria bacterium]